MRRTPTDKATLDHREWSYSSVGVTLDESAWRNASNKPVRTYERSIRLGAGEHLWSFASDAVLAWGIKTRSGFTIESPGAPTSIAGPVRPGERFWLLAHIGPMRIREPVEVVGVVDEVHRKGFAYGTLRGHPVSGEELFVIEHRPDGSVWLTLRSMTGPADGLWRVAYPAILLAQPFYRRRYGRALAPHR